MHSTCELDIEGKEVWKKVSMVTIIVDSLRQRISTTSG